MVLRAQAAVRAEEPLGDLELRGSGPYLLHQPLHGLIVHAGGGAHELALAGILEGARIVDRVGGDREGRRRTCLHERNEPAGGELLVYAERTRRIAQLDDERDGVVGVGERDHVRAGCRRVGKEPVNQKGRGPRGGDEKREKALVGLGVVAGQPPDGERVHHYELGEPAGSEVCPYAGDAVYMHDASLGRRGSHAPSVAPARPRPNRPLVSPCREIAFRSPLGAERGPKRDFSEEVEDRRRDKGSAFDEFRDVIESKAAMPGVTKKAIHEFLLDRHPDAALPK